MTGPLEGRRILVTRAREQGRGLERSISELGGEAVWVPAIETVRVPLEGKRRETVEALGYFDWVAFTSENALRYFFDNLEELGLGMPEGIRVASVGASTSKACRRRGLAVAAQPTKYTGRHLGELLATRFPPGRLLEPRSSVGRDDLAAVLKASGWEVVSLPCYATRAARLSAADVESIERGLDAALFASPSAVRGLWGNLPGLARESLGRARCIPIGPTTAAALEEVGLNSAPPPAESTAEGLIQALVEGLGRTEAGG